MKWYLLWRPCPCNCFRRSERPSPESTISSKPEMNTTVFRISAPSLSICSLVRFLSTVHTSFSPVTYSTPLTPFHRESPSPFRSISTILTLSRGTVYRSEAMKTFIIVDNSALFCPVITISAAASRSRTSGLKSAPSPRGSGSDEELLLNCGHWSRARRGTPEGS